MAFQQGPWWQWMGGFLGATVLIINILEVPRLGAGTVSAVLVSSLVILVPIPYHCISVLQIFDSRSCWMCPRAWVMGGRFRVEGMTLDCARVHVTVTRLQDPDSISLFPTPLCAEIFIFIRCFRGVFMVELYYRSICFSWCTTKGFNGLAWTGNNWSCWYIPRLFSIPISFYIPIFSSMIISSS